MMVYHPADKKYYPETEVKKVRTQLSLRMVMFVGQGDKVLKLSGTEVRRRLQTGEEIPVLSPRPHRD